MAVDKKIYRAGYMSEIDQFLREFDQTRKTCSLSRLKELEKHQKIAAMRDKPVEDKPKGLWEKF